MSVWLTKHLKDKYSKHRALITTPLLFANLTSRPWPPNSLISALFHVSLLFWTSWVNSHSSYSQNICTEFPSVVSFSPSLEKHVNIAFIFFSSIQNHLLNRDVPGHLTIFSTFCILNISFLVSFLPLVCTI